MARGGATGADGFEPFTVVPDRTGDAWWRRSEAHELTLGQQVVASVVGKDHAVFTHKQDARIPVDGLTIVVGQLGQAVWASGTVVPMEDQLVPLVVERPSAVEILGRAYGMCGLGRVGRDHLGRAKFEGPKRQVHVVAAHVGQGAAAKLPEASPASWVQTVAVRSLGTVPKPQLPVEVFGSRRFWCTVSSAGPVFPAPDMHFRDVADGLASHQFHDPPVVVSGVDLRAHLGDQILAQGSHGLGLFHAVGERLFAVAVQPPLHGGHRSGGVGVVRRRNHDGIEIQIRLQHFSVIPERCGVLVLIGRALQVTVIHITQGDHLFMTHCSKVGRASVAYPNEPDSYGLELGTPRSGGVEDRSRPSEERGFE